MSIAGTIPQLRQILPDFNLPSFKGGEYHISDFRGRRNLVLVFIASETHAVLDLLSHLNQREDELGEEETQVFAILPGNSTDAKRAVWQQFWFPVLMDRDGAIHRRYGADLPAVYISDRYGEIYYSYHSDVPTIEEVMSSVRYINAECPE